MFCFSRNKIGVLFIYLLSAIIWYVYNATYRKVYGDVVDKLPTIEMPYFMKCPVKYAKCEEGYIDGWSYLHIALHFIAGFFFPGEDLFVIFLSYLTEAMEYFAGYRARFIVDPLINYVSYKIGELFNPREYQSPLRISKVVLLLLILTLLIALQGVSKNRLFWQEKHSKYPTKKGDTLRVVSYNIAHGRGDLETDHHYDLWYNFKASNKNERVKKIGERLKDYDVAFLCEVDFNCLWNFYKNHCSLINEGAQFPYIINQVNYDILPIGRWGNVLLSRYPIVKAEKVDLEPEKSFRSFGGKKDGIYCEIQVGDKLVKIIGIHLYPDEESRKKQLEEVLKIAKEKDVDLLLGDLNEPYKNLQPLLYTKELKLMRDSSRRSRRGTRQDGNEVDHILYKGEKLQPLSECVTDLGMNGLSDHPAKSQVFKLKV